jgi:hypothetical protein
MDWVVVAMEVQCFECKGSYASASCVQPAFFQPSKSELHVSKVSPSHDRVHRPPCVSPHPLDVHEVHPKSGEKTIK